MLKFSFLKVCHRVVGIVCFQYRIFLCKGKLNLALSILPRDTGPMLLMLGTETLVSVRYIRDLQLACMVLKIFFENLHHSSMKVDKVRLDFHGPSPAILKYQDGLHWANRSGFFGYNLNQEVLYGWHILMKYNQQPRGAIHGDKWNRHKPCLFQVNLTNFSTPNKILYRWFSARLL